MASAVAERTSQFLSEEFVWRTRLPQQLKPARQTFGDIAED